MGLMPGARLALIDHDNLDEMDAHQVLVFHTGVGHDPFPAAHLSVGSLGEIAQSRDDDYQSAACLDGNPYCVAVETEDTGDPFPVWYGNDVPEWTEAQVHSNARIAAWQHLTRGLPLVQCPNSLPGATGVGWHRLGINGNFVPGIDYPGRVPGGVRWSSKFGKGCPGNRRIRQVIERVIPLARFIVSLPNDQRWRVIAGKEPIPDQGARRPTGGDDVLVFTDEKFPDSRCGLLSGGYVFDMSTDGNGRTRTQEHITAGTAPGVVVWSRSTWNAWLAAGRVITPATAPREV